MVDGHYRQVLLSPRELNATLLPTRNFINEHFTYTHGMGLTLSPVNEVTSEGLPVLFIKDLPPTSTGSLKVTGPQHPKALYFRGGRILFGSSNDPRDQLGSILIEYGKITREQLEDVNTRVGPGNPLAKVLADSGFVNQRELGDAARPSPVQPRQGEGG